MIQPYIDILLSVAIPEDKLKIAALYRKIIQKRYSDYRVVCMFFSRPDDLRQPDLSQAWSLFPLKKEYIIGACGVTFNKHRQGKTYPKESTILSFCPQPAEKLVVGGFHLWDCVNKAAKHAYEQGIDVEVDEDLTELFFSPRLEFIKKRIAISPAESREKRIERLKKAGRYFLETARQERLIRPWMVQL